MIPTFLRSEIVPYASVEIIPAEALLARETDTQPPERLRIICAWCPDFDGTHPSNAGASHGMCEPCAALFDAAILADRENDRDSDQDGTHCGAGCGFCGRCS